MTETMSINFLIERIDDLKIAADTKGKKGVGMVFTAPDPAGGEVRFGLTIEAVRTLHHALTQIPIPPNPVLPRQ